MSERHIKTVSEIQSFSYGDFLRIRLKALRNGGWRRLDGFEKALFNASMQLARIRGRIVNPSLVEAVKNVVLKIVQPPLVIITRLSREQAGKLLQLYKRKGVFQWAPVVKNWFKDPGYLLWLGVKHLTLRSIGYL